MEKSLLETVWLELKEQDSPDLRESLARKLNLSPKRINALYEIIGGEKSIDYFPRLDIQAYLAKTLRPDEYDSQPLVKHAYSVGDHTVYDPAKNGQNILKHGLCFNEVTSFSKKFGTFQVLIENEKDMARNIIFSDLAGLGDVTDLCFPLPKINSEKYILTVATLDGEGRFRFISSRQLSSQTERYRSTIKGALREDGATEESLSKLTNSCVEYLERYVFLKEGELA